MGCWKSKVRISRGSERLLQGYSHNGCGSASLLSRKSRECWRRREYEVISVAQSSWAPLVRGSSSLSLKHWVPGCNSFSPPCSSTRKPLGSPNLSFFFQTGMTMPTLDQISLFLGGKKKKKTGPPLPLSGTAHYMTPPKWAQKLREMNV